MRDDSSPSHVRRRAERATGRRRWPTRRVTGRAATSVRRTACSRRFAARYPELGDARNNVLARALPAWIRPIRAESLDGAMASLDAYLPIRDRANTSPRRRQSGVSPGSSMQLNKPRRDERAVQGLRDRKERRERSARRGGEKHWRGSSGKRRGDQTTEGRVGEGQRRARSDQTASLAAADADARAEAKTDGAQSAVEKFVDGW